jgi:hypothetical protein
VHAREFNVEFGRTNCSPCGQELRPGRLIVLATRIQFFLRDCFGGKKAMRALQIVAAQLEPNFRAGYFGARLIGDGFVGAWINDDKQVALLNQRALMKMHRLQIPVDAGANFNGGHGGKSAGILIPVRNLLYQRFRNVDLGRRGLHWAAGSDACRQRQNDGHDRGKPDWSGIWHCGTEHYRSPALGPETVQPRVQHMTTDEQA